MNTPNLSLRQLRKARNYLNTTGPVVYTGDNKGSDVYGPLQPH